MTQVKACPWCGGATFVMEHPLVGVRKVPAFLRFCASPTCGWQRGEKGHADGYTVVWSTPRGR